MAVAYTVLCLAACVCLSVSLKSWDVPGQDPWRHLSADLDHQWMTFKKSYNRTYSDGTEEIRRRLYWEDTTRLIENHNAAYSRGDTSFYLAENDFADMAEDEFAGLYLRGLRPPADDDDYPPALAEPDLDLPPTFDWQKEGMVTSVKNQGQCGSCWAFSALGALEAKHKMKTGQLVDLSEQNLVDCSYRNYGNFGCQGGWMNNAFRYIKNVGGIDSERCYPYRGHRRQCGFRRNCVKAQLAGYKKVRKSESSLQRAVARKGPVCIGVDASDRLFWSYKSGVLNIPHCKRRVISHAMLVVGYGTYRGRDYWKVKNSWGKKWGRSGYVYMSRNKNSQCGIADYASYPV